jgi:hypothetical protein
LYFLAKAGMPKAGSALPNNTITAIHPHRRHPREESILVSQMLLVVNKHSKIKSLHQRCNFFLRLEQTAGWHCHLLVIFWSLQ